MQQMPGRHAYLDGLLGLEYMLSPNLSVFVEYDYLNFGTASVNFTFPAGSIPPVNTFQIAVVVQFERRSANKKLQGSNSERSIATCQSAQASPT